MTAFHFIGGLAEVSFGLSELEKEGRFRQADDGFPTEICKGNHIRVESDGTRAVITCGTRIEFFRALGLLLEHGAGDVFELEETPAFETCGVMFDLSRNAVLKREGFEFFIRRMALMGLNMAMLYLEDTYEVSGEPFFGYQRGRYSQEELRRMDDYADAFGIELIPAIQTLGHLEKVLRWNAYAPYRDTDDILLAEDEKALALVEKMIRAASAPFRTKRIHLGMDEAEGIGGGVYLRKNGFRPKLDILSTHFQNVMDICRKLGLKPMIWSDMYLKLLFEDGNSYYDDSDPEQPLPDGLAKMVPPDAALVYWDYYQMKESTYDNMVRKHRRFPNEIIFAGGGWTWGSISPLLGTAFATSNAALKVMKRNGMKEVFCTLWGDDGAETSLLCSLPVLQLYAEYCYQSGVPEQDLVARRFAACCGAGFGDFWALRLFDETPGVEKNNPRFCNPSKYLLYQDVLLGLFDRHAEGLPLEGWYAELASRMAEAERSSPLYAKLFAHYSALADVLSKKSLLGVNTTKAYRAGDKDALRACAETCNILLADADRLEQTWSELWFSTYKPFGFEQIDQRLGGMEMRLRRAKKRLESYLAGEVSSLPELETPRLFFDGRTETGDFPAASCEFWNRIISVG